MWAAQLCDVLGYLHRQSPPVIFRDLKPANVMLTPSGQLKLIDFGIARFFKAGQAGDTLVMGTPGYAAPEQHGTGQTDARSDVYSLGVVLHRMLTLHDPGSTPFTLPAIHQFNPQVTPEMEQLVARATQIQASQRFQTMAEVRQALAGAPAPTAPATLPGSRKPPGRHCSLVHCSPVYWSWLSLVGAGWIFGRRAFDPPPATPLATVAVVPTAEPTETPVPTATLTPLVSCGSHAAASAHPDVATQHGLHRIRLGCVE